jgi:hypothetical protein
MRMSDFEVHTPGDAVEWIFARWRRRYGNHAITRYETGVIGANGKDKGLADAVEEWAHEFCRIGPKVAHDAMTRAEAAHPRWPPTLPEFMLHVAAVTPAAHPAAREEKRIESTPAAREAEFEAMRAILKAARLPKRSPGRPKKENPGQGSLLADSQGLGA